MLNDQLASLHDDSGKTVMHVAAEQGFFSYISFCWCCTSTLFCRINIVL